MKKQLIYLIIKLKKFDMPSIVWLAKRMCFKPLCIILVTLIFLGQVASASGAKNTELEKAEKKYEELIKRVKALKKIILHDDEEAKQYIQKHFPKEISQKIISKWETFMFYLLKGMSYLALLTSPFMAIKHLILGFYLEQLLIDEEEIDLLDAQNDLYEAAKKKIDQINDDINGYKAQIWFEEKCMDEHIMIVSEVKELLLEADPYEKALRELERAVKAARLAAKAREDTRAALTHARDAKVKAEAAINSVKRQEELKETIKKECDNAKALVEETRAAQKAAAEQFIKVLDYLDLTQKERNRACAAATRFRQIHLLTQDDIDILEVSSVQAMVLSNEASRKCADSAKEVALEAERAKNTSGKIEKIQQKIAELSSQLKDGDEIKAKLDNIIAAAEAKLLETQGKPLETEMFADTAEYARDKVFDILSTVSNEERAKQMIGKAKKTAENAKSAAVETENLYKEAQSVIKTLKSGLETIGERISHLSKEKPECKLSPVKELLKDAQASKDSAEMASRKAAHYAVEAEHCVEFVTEIAIDPKHGFDLKIRSIKPIVPNISDLNFRTQDESKYDSASNPMHIDAGQAVNLYLEYVVSGFPGGTVNIQIKPSVVLDSRKGSLEMDTVKRRVTFAENESQKVFQAYLTVPVPYPTALDGASYHLLRLERMINEQPLQPLVIGQAFGVAPPGTDFNGTGDLRICVVDQNDEDRSWDELKYMVQSLSGGAQYSKIHGGATCEREVTTGLYLPDFEKLPLGKYRVMVQAQGDKSYKGPRSGSAVITLYRRNPQERHFKNWGCTVKMGETRGEKRPSFARPRKLEKQEKLAGPGAWTVQIELIDMKGRPISNARVFTADGALTADERIGGKYLLGPIKNVKNVPQKVIEVIADISFKSPSPSLLGHKRTVSVVLKDKAHVYATIKFDDYEEGKTNLGGFSGHGGGGRPSWVPDKPDSSGGEDTAGGTRPSWAGGRKQDDPGGDSGPKKDEEQTKDTGTGEGQMVKMRSREECEKKYCPECFFMGTRIDRNELPKGGDDPCRRCTNNKADLIEQCIQGK